MRFQINPIGKKNIVVAIPAVHHVVLGSMIFYSLRSGHETPYVIEGGLCQKKPEPYIHRDLVCWSLADHLVKGLEGFRTTSAWREAS